MRSLNTAMDVLDNIHSSAGLGMHKGLSDLVQGLLMFYSGDFKVLKNQLDENSIELCDEILMTAILTINELAAIEAQLKERILQNLGNNGINVFEQTTSESVFEQLRGVN